MKSRFNQIYEQVMNELANDQAEEAYVVNGSFSNPAALARDLGMTYDDFSIDLNSMADELERLHVQIEEDKGMFHFTLTGDESILASLLKVPTVGHSLDQDEGTLAYDLSDGSYTPNDVINSTMETLEKCEKIDSIEETTKESLQKALKTESNAKQKLLNPGFLESAREMLER